MSGWPLAFTIVGTFLGVIALVVIGLIAETPATTGKDEGK